MRRLRFLQISDLHLGCGLAGSKFGFPPAKQARINRDIEVALARAAEIAREEKVDVVLCPGDLWDDEAVGLQSASSIYDILGSLAPTPVLIAPGNHDPYNAFSYHHPSYYVNKVGRTHPSNVVVFNSPRVDRRVIDALPGVEFYGCCFEENRPRRERMLADLKPKRDDTLNILLMHGSQDDLLAGRGEDQMMAAPFTSAELVAAGFDYAALGHYHRHSVIADPGGAIRGAYSGVPVARRLDETGEHGVIVAEAGRGGVAPDALRLLPVSSRRILRFTAQVDPSVTNTAAARGRVITALRDHGVSADDIVLVQLEGRTHPEITRFDFDPEWCDVQCFHLIVDQSALEPDYDIDAMLNDETSSKRIEGRFAGRMRQLMTEAGGDPARLRILRAAFCYGLDALNGREARPRNVH
ncbi:MAG: DNA repair exonuclease [bacterium]